MSRLLVVGTLVAGFALRLLLLNAWPLREDEALYAYWARHFWLDPRFLSVFPDKPPLFIWLQAVALELFGSTSAGARVLSIAASTVTIALVVAGARTMWRSTQTQFVWASVAACVLIALNPFAIAFAATGYTDSLLVAFGTAAIILALRARPAAAGVLLGAAIMTKQQGLLYVPLVVALVLLAAWDARAAKSYALLKVLGWLTAGTLAVVAPIMLWDASRWATAPSPWDLGAQNYAAFAVVSPVLWLERTADWFALIWYGAASSWAWILLAALAACLLWGWQHMRSRRALSSVERWSPVLLALWMFCFLAAHLFTTVQPWDRYLLLIFPVLAILLGGGVGWLVEWMTLPPANHNVLVRLVVGVGAVVALLVLIPPALQSARGELPIGADHGDYAGLDDAAHWIANRPDERISVYHRALGWNLDFALFDAVQSAKVELRWHPSSVYLADNVIKNPARRNLVVEPEWAASRDLAQQAAVRGLAVSQVARFDKVAIFELAPKAAELCTWCECSQPLWDTIPAEPDSLSPAS